jgi:hypothetical protein
LPATGSHYFKQSGSDEMTICNITEAVAAERARLLPLLAHAVKEADAWHDESRGGPIKDDPFMDEARADRMEL